MTFTIEMVRHTPPWVFLLLAYLVYAGIQALGPRTVPVWRVLIVPAIFILSGVSRILLAHEPGIWPCLSWLIAALIFFPPAFLSKPGLLAVDRKAGTITHPGTPVVLIRNVFVFLVQYVVEVVSAVDPGQYPSLPILAHAVSGATAGYFLGWSIALLRRYRGDPARIVTVS